MKIAHLADIQIRFGQRHPEYRQVFARLYEDLRANRPDRIYLAGDIVHQKITLSPNLLNLLAEFLIELSKIAPTDVILGNHDMNMQDHSQGDALSPIFKILNLVGDKTSVIVNEYNKDTVDFNRKAVYLFPDSGFYDIDDYLTYGVFSCMDDKIITLEKKEPGRFYAALFHGTVYGARNDNGHLATGDGLIKPSTFNNFDIGMLGDIHEHQAVEREKGDISETLVYAGSLIQQNMGESLDKGYLLWNTEDKTFERKFILNDYGYSQVHISRGENAEERISHMKFSNDRRKTKVKITWEDYEENYSLEKEIQLKKMVKDKHGCEVVTLEFKEIKKVLEDLEDESQEEERPYIEYFREFIENNEFDDCDEAMIKEVLEYAEEVDDILEITEERREPSTWYLKSVEISNLFSFPKTPTFFNFENLQGIVGVFGKNGNGKSNLIKAIVWGLYDKILGANNRQTYGLVNLYTDSEIGYAKYYLVIDDEDYMIERKVTRKAKKDGTYGNAYKITYKKLHVILDEDGNIEDEKWVSKISDKETTVQKEVKDMVIESIGTLDDFSKTSLQAQKGDSNYFSLAQQEKNNLINKFIGLEDYRDRYAYVKDFFNKIKAKQKELGDVLEIEEKIKAFDADIEIKERNLESLEGEKKINSTKKTDTDNRILEYTQKLEKIENLVYEDRGELQAALAIKEQDLINLKDEHLEVQTWLGSNFKKTLPFKEGETLQKIQIEIKEKDATLQSDKNSFLAIKKWLAENPLQNTIDVSGVEANIVKYNSDLTTYKAELKVHAGEDCPTCKRAMEGSEPNPEEHKNCEIKIKQIEKELAESEKIIREQKAIVDSNTKYNNQKVQYDALYSSCLAQKETIDTLKEKEKEMKESEHLIAHNEMVDTKSARFQVLTTTIESTKAEIARMKENDSKIDDLVKKKAHNETIQEEIDKLQAKSKEFQLNVFNLDKQIVEFSGDIKVLKSNKENFNEKLEDIRNAERLFKKYSIYMQAVHRDGIPALIIRKKLPIINSKINGILDGVVKFKVELKILANGDVVEQFFFAEDKSDALPTEFLSGAQEFVSIIAIKEALHHMSTLPKASLSIIDEGFGSLDDELTFEMQNILQYLKSRHRNVLVITHKNEIKDFADRIIEVKKDSSSIPKEVLEVNPDAGISKVSVR